MPPKNTRISTKTPQNNVQLWKSNENWVETALLTINRTKNSNFLVYFLLNDKGHHQHDGEYLLGVKISAKCFYLIENTISFRCKGGHQHCPPVPHFPHWNYRIERGKKHNLRQASQKLLQKEGSIFFQVRLGHLCVQVWLGIVHNSLPKMLPKSAFIHHFTCRILPTGRELFLWNFHPAPKSAAEYRSHREIEMLVPLLRLMAIREFMKLR